MTVAAGCIRSPPKLAAAADRLLNKCSLETSLDDGGPLSVGFGRFEDELSLAAPPPWLFGSIKYPWLFCIALRHNYT